MNTLVLTDPAQLDAVRGPFDAALIDGALENERWDRWLLQRVHRLLRDDAPIVVAVAPLVSFSAAADLRFLGYVSRKAAQRLVRCWRPDFEIAGATRRRYHPPRLSRTLAAVGFTGIERGPALARRATLRARKAPNAAGARSARWEARLHARRYAEQCSAMPAAREAWLARFPEYRAASPQALEPAQWRDARVLVLAPHPDDELIGCGGTLCRLVAAGASVTILYATEGSRLESLRGAPEAVRRRARVDEARRVAAALGARAVVWAHEESRFACDVATVRAMAMLLAEVRPTHVFTPFLGDSHADHRTLSRVLALAAVEAPVLQYEVWGLVPANLVCDVTPAADALESLLLLYRHAMQADDFVQFCESRNRARGLEVTGAPAYLEAFLSMPGADYRRLAERNGEAP